MSDTLSSKQMDHMDELVRLDDQNIRNAVREKDPVYIANRFNQLFPVGSTERHEVAGQTVIITVLKAASVRSNSRESKCYFTGMDYRKDERKEFEFTLNEYNGIVIL